MDGPAWTACPREQPTRARVVSHTPHDPSVRRSAPVINPFRDQDSARLSLMAQADALLVRPAGDPARRAGDVVCFLPLRR